MIYKARPDVEPLNKDKSGKKKTPVFITDKNLDKVKKLTTTAKVQVVYLDSDAKEIDGPNGAVAKQIQYAKGSKYYLMANRGNKLFNPLKDDINAKTIHAKKKLDEFEMREVTKKSFDKYVEYLKTKNSYHLGQAEIERGR